MNEKQYEKLLNLALDTYLESPTFIGYLYPGQFYDFTHEHDTFKLVSVDNSYRYMVSLEAQVNKRQGIIFSRLSPAQKGERAASDTFGQILALARKHHKKHDGTALSVFLAKNMQLDRRAVTNEVSRYFGGLKQLRYLVEQTSLTKKDFPPLIRGHYKDLVTRLFSQNADSLRRLKTEAT